jgi:hypothetical protein
VPFFETEIADFAAAASAHRTPRAVHRIVLGNESREYLAHSDRCRHVDRRSLWQGPFGSHRERFHQLVKDFVGHLPAQVSLPA